MTFQVSFEKTFKHPLSSTCYISVCLSHNSTLLSGETETLNTNDSSRQQNMIIQYHEQRSSLLGMVPSQIRPTPSQFLDIYLNIILNSTEPLCRMIPHQNSESISCFPSYTSSSSNILYITAIITQIQALQSSPSLHNNRQSSFNLSLQFAYLNVLLITLLYNTCYLTVSLGVESHAPSHRTQAKFYCFICLYFNLQRIQNYK